jgi:hypothetical protein
MYLNHKYLKNNLSIKAYNLNEEITQFYRRKNLIKFYKLTYRYPR